MPPSTAVERGIQASMSSNGDDSKRGDMELTRSMAVVALALSVQEWKEIGRGDEATATPDDLPTAVERITALLLVRLVALLEKPGTFKDLSTSTICRHALMNGQGWPAALTAELVQQLRSFVQVVLSAYRPLPFHNFQHAYHVVVSANKLLDLMLEEDSFNSRDRPPPTYGLRHDPILLTALMFSALIHDVDHQGVTNNQLVKEGDRLSLLYNDNSMLEQRSLQLAFEEILKPDYSKLYSVLFPFESDYTRFRLMVVESVLSTDIASPDRSQLSKSKWKEAFGEPQEAVERKERARRSSVVSDISMPRVGGQPRYSRRGSNVSISSTMSDVTTDSYVMTKRHPPHFSRRMSNESTYSEFASDSLAQGVKARNRQRRRASNQSVESNYSDYAADSVQMGKAGPRKTTRPPPKNGRRVSLDSMTSDYDSGACRNPGYPMPRRLSTQTGSERTMQSLAADSVGLAQKRREGGAYTRPKRYMSSPVPNYDDDDDDGGDSDIDSFKNVSESGLGFDDSDDSSLSLTPPSSDDENDGVVVTGYTLTNSQHMVVSRPTPVRGVASSRSGGAVLKDMSGTKSPKTSRSPVSRRASTGNLPMRFGSLTGQRIDEDHADERQSINNLDNRLGHSMHGNSSHIYRKRLGIRRSIDFSGESIEVYSRQRSIGGATTFTELRDNADLDFDEPDDLKAAVIMELMLRAADVSHNMQSWENMTLWMSRLFKELISAHEAGRGIDPCRYWFDNQIKVIEYYLMPLANRLEEVGVFVDEVGASFAEVLQENHDRWMIEGFDLIPTWKVGDRLEV